MPLHNMYKDGPQAKAKYQPPPQITAPVLQVVLTSDYAVSTTLELISIGMKL